MNLLTIVNWGRYIFFKLYSQDEGTIQAMAIVEPEDIFHLPTRTNRGGQKPLENYQSLLETAT